MDSSIKIGIKFCGNCNPHIDTVGLLKKLKDYFKEIQFVNWDAWDYDVLLILNSCPVGCATCPNFSGPTIIIKSDSIDHNLVSPENIAEETIKKIDEFIRRV